MLSHLKKCKNASYTVTVLPLSIDIINFISLSNHTISQIGSNHTISQIGGPLTKKADSSLKCVSLTPSFSSNQQIIFGLPKKTGVYNHSLVFVKITNQQIIFGLTKNTCVTIGPNFHKIKYFSLAKCYDAVMTLLVMVRPLDYAIKISYPYVPLWKPPTCVEAQIKKLYFRDVFYSPCIQIYKLEGTKKRHFFCERKFGPRQHFQLLTSSLLCFSRGHRNICFRGHACQIYNMI